MLLVTGATGFIGGHLVERLAVQSRPFRCLVRRSSQVRLPVAAELAYGDLATGEGLAEALSGVDTVIHLAGVTKGRTPADFEAGNATATANLVRAAGNVRRLVHVSSLAAAGPSPDGQPLSEDAPPHPVSHYGRTKLAGEQAVRQSALWSRTIIVRPPVVFGPRDTDVYQFLKTVANGWIVRVGAGEGRFSFVYVEDLVAGLLAAADDPGPGGKIFFVAHPQPSSWQEFGFAAARIMGRRARTVTLPESAAYAVAACAEWWARLTRKPGILSRDKIIEGCCPAWICDTAHARRDLGFSAGTDLDAGLRLTLNWYREAAWLKF